jgi:hypothetical protein
VVRRVGRRVRAAMVAGVATSALAAHVKRRLGSAAKVRVEVRSGKARTALAVRAR